MLELIGIVTTILAVIGVLLNNRKLRICFIFWFFSNFLSGLIHCQAVHYQEAMWTLALRDLVFFVLAIDGWFRWGKEDKCRK